MKTVNKTNLPNSIFSFDSNFLLLLINLATSWSQKYECFRTYISYQKISHTDCSLQSASLKLMGMFWIYCYHVSRFSRKPHWKISFLVIFFCLLHCEFMYRYFNKLVHFGRIFFPASLVGCFLRMLNKQGGTFFTLRWSLYIENIVPAMPGLRLARTWWKTSRLHINATTNLWRNEFSCLISSIVPSRLSCKQPLEARDRGVLKLFNISCKMIASG